jgi:hypothetical protein
VSESKDAGENAQPRPEGRLARLLGPAFSPHGLVARAAIITLIFCIAHLAGLREYTTIISGTSPTGDVRDFWAIFLGAGYTMLYLAFSLVVPALLIAAGLLAACFGALGRGARASHYEESAE